MAEAAHYASLVFLSLFVLAVVYGAIGDVDNFKIPNRVSYGILLLFVGYAAVNWGRIPLLSHFALGVFVTTVCIVFWKLRWFGGGDAKFVGAIAFWMGPEKMLVFVILLSLISAVMIAVLRFVRQWNDYLQASAWPRVAKNLVQKASENAIPYGLPAAIAAIVALLPGIAGR